MLEFLLSNIVVMFVSNMSLLFFDEFIIELWICLVNVDLSVFYFCFLSQMEVVKEVIGSYVLFFVVIINGDFVIICKDGV